MSSSCDSESVVNSENTCNVCSKSFNTKSNLNRHVKNVHGIESSCTAPKNMHCSECNEYFGNYISIMNHYRTFHEDIVIVEEELSFSDRAQFVSWKEETEKKTVAEFVVQKGMNKKISKDGATKYEYFHCHRSGNFTPVGCGKRSQKLGGTNKIGRFCPARIVVKSTLQSVNVKFVSTHLGHDCETGRLRLKTSEKNMIAATLQEGVPMDRIMQNLAENFSPTKRLPITTRKDLWNIQQTYNIESDKILNQNDAVSVETWVNLMKSESDNPVLLYKPQDILDENSPGLSPQDFMLGFMNEAQQTIFERFGNNIISIDSTHGTNKYGIELTSIVVCDDNCEGFPVAFLYSNRQSEVHYKLFFSSIKERITVKPRVFMTDDAPAFYNAWESVFGPTEYRLLCDWHIQRAWNENLRKISSKEKRESVLGKLKAMHSELDEETFEILLTEYVKTFLEDPETADFGEYFQNTYSNRKRLWAKCYRKKAGINTNMMCERWHKDLKYYSDLNGKQGGRLDKAIASLMKSLQKKIVSRAVSIQRHKLSSKMSSLRKRHKHSLEMEVSVIENIPGKSWTVSSESITDLYQVEKVLQSCNCKIRCDPCGSCIDQFTCTCHDNIITYNMCKHIHLICTRFPEAHAVSESSDTDGNLLIKDTNSAEATEFDSISNQLKKDGRLQKPLEAMKEEVRALLLSALTELDKCTTVAEVETVKKTACTLIPQLEAVRASNKRRPFPSNVTVPANKNICKQRRLYSVKKKRANRPTLHVNTSPVLETILQHKQEQSSVPL